MEPSIFNLEKRFDFDRNYNRLINLCSENGFYVEGLYRAKDLWYVIDENIKRWPYRGDACNYMQYLYDIGVDTCFGNIGDLQKMYVLEFLLNITFFVKPKTKKHSVQYQTVIDNIYYIIERLNYEVHENDGKFTFAKRDADVDSVLNDFKDDKDMRMALLSYNDFRIENNISEKKQILQKFANWMEPQKDYYKQINANLSKTVFGLFNKAGIRHENDGQIIFKDKTEQLDVYDKLFKTVLHLIRAKEIKEYQNYLKEFVNE